ncbi:peptidoglycan editing factor PgeF [Qipengyuania qiaonensis]|uniref:Purine nucleoside phosphorylase n=1 Tax=Qipengyuania qiaonensis TaxID=2867240 RepID=A0ABS7J8F5_9SPHN|nr:peptidoglycan editing factor PgeF [Qipengyuania qiaonensis]MBX7482344.1 peptidoglycan editing factor PgeF [Qipengyuania qiaonensis]
MGDHLQARVLEGLPHGFSTAREPDLAAILPGAELVRVKQVHGRAVVEATKARDALLEADGIVSARTGLLLGIVTADCAPVLFADPVAGVVGAAHAGWRGALGGVLEETVTAMIALGAQPENIGAAIGPTISQPSYEVDQAFERQFAETDSHFFAAGREGHLQFDLPAYVVHRLSKVGVSRVEDLAEDTYSQPGRFHSYRRATHRGETTNGRQLSVIGLPASG